MSIGTPVSVGTGATSNVGAGLSTFIMSTSTTTPTGSLLVVAFWYNGNATGIAVTGVADASSNTYSKAFADGSPVNSSLELWYCANCTGLASSTTITATFSPSTSGTQNGGNLCAAYVTGIVTSSALDQTAGQLSATTPNTATTSALGQSSEIAFGAAGIISEGATYTEPSGFTNINNSVTTGNSGGKTELDYQTVSTTAAVVYATTWSSSTRNGALVATFKAAGVGSSYMFSPAIPFK